MRVRVVLCLLLAPSLLVQVGGRWQIDELFCFGRAALQPDRVLMLDAFNQLYVRHAIHHPPIPTLPYPTLPALTLTLQPSTTLT